MPYIVTNNRRGRPVRDDESGIELLGKRTLTDAEMAKLVKHPAIREMLGCDDKGEPLGTELLTVVKVEPTPEAHPAPVSKSKEK